MHFIWEFNKLLKSMETVFKKNNRIFDFYFIEAHNKFKVTDKVKKKKNMCTYLISKSVLSFGYHTTFHVQ